MMAYVTRYIFGTDKLRPNSFEVRGLNGVSTGIVHCDDSAILSQWLKYITDNIVSLTHLQVSSKEQKNYWTFKSKALYRILSNFRGFDCYKLLHFIVWTILNNFSQTEFFILPHNFRDITVLKYPAFKSKSLYRLFSNFRGIDYY